MLTRQSTSDVAVTTSDTAVVTTNAAVATVQFDADVSAPAASEDAGSDKTIAPTTIEASDKVTRTVSTESVPEPAASTGISSVTGTALSASADLGQSTIWFPYDYPHLTRHSYCRRRSHYLSYPGCRRRRGYHHCAEQQRTCICHLQYSRFRRGDG